jgi:hypothetical protein
MVADSDDEVCGIAGLSFCLALAAVNPAEVKGNILSEVIEIEVYLAKRCYSHAR